MTKDFGLRLAPSSYHLECLVTKLIVYCVVRRKLASSGVDITVPLDIKVELAAGLTLCIVASVLAMTKNLTNVSAIHAN